MARARATALRAPRYAQGVRPAVAPLLALLCALSPGPAPAAAAPAAAAPAPSPAALPGCRGCLLLAPAGPGPPRAAVVLLHGDGGAPARLVSLLAREAAARRVLLFAPLCPVERGCAARSFWRWPGAAAWLAGQLDALGRAHPVEGGRLFLLGWSGGASFATAAPGALLGRFSALGLAGGGMPSELPCAPRPAPVYFLSGERNPLRGLAEGARDQLRRCGHVLRWVSLPGADHEAEWRALREREAAAMLAFFLDGAAARP